MAHLQTSAPAPAETGSTGGPPSAIPEAPPRADPARSGLAHHLALLGKRRSFLINSRAQLRAGFLTAACALVLLVLLNLSLYSSRRSVTDHVLADSPELEQILNAQNRVELALIVTASIVFLGGVFVVTVLETHKTAGASFNLARHMAEIQHGQYGTRIRLRKDDNLRELEAAFNAMSKALQDRAGSEAAELERLAETAERLAGPDEARELALRLRARSASLRGCTG